MYTLRYEVLTLIIDGKGIGIRAGNSDGVCSSSLQSMPMEPAFDPDLIHGIFKRIWVHKAAERKRNYGAEVLDSQATGAAGSSKKNRPTSANSKSLKLAAELLRMFVSEAVQRAATIAEAEGSANIEPTHLERILPQLLLDF